MTHIKFDYSKALRFFEERELDYLEPAVKQLMIHYIMVQVLVMMHLVGLTYQQITTKKNLLVSKKQQKNPQRLRRINRYRYRWFLSWGTCCNRNFKSFLL